jgi:hypothetical protein
LWTLCQAGLEPRFSRSEPPTYKGVSHWCPACLCFYTGNFHLKVGSFFF